MAALVETAVIVVVAALLTATLSGALGMGGGITLLGVMTALLPAPVVVPLHGVVQLASNFTRTIAYLQYVHWKTFLVYVGPATLGIALATSIWSEDKLTGFRVLIGAFILFFLVWRRYAPKLRNLPLVTFAPLGLVVGFLAIFVGATGPFLAPFFLRDDFERHQVIATKAICQAWLHLFKIPAFLSLGFDYGRHADLLLWLIVAVIAGTYLGRYLLGKLTPDWFLWLFQGLLGLIAVYLLVTGIAVL